MTVVSGETQSLPEVLRRIRENMQASRNESSTLICQNRGCNNIVTDTLSGLCDDCRKLQYYAERVKMLPAKYIRLVDRYGTIEQAKELSGTSLFLYGASGTGKTVLATFILKALWKEWKEGRFISYPRYIMYLQSHYEEGYDHVHKLAFYRGCLVLDDFGAERLTDYIRQVSYYIINTREQNDLQTIITSNYSLDQINQFIDDRLSSRISGMCEVIHVEGKDKRIKNC